MTHGPQARVKETVSVQLPRPRRSMTPDFVEIYNALEASIRAESEAMLNG